MKYSKPLHFLTFLLAMLSVIIPFACSHNQEKINAPQKYIPYQVDQISQDFLFYFPIHQDSSALSKEYSGLTFLHFSSSDSLKYFNDSVNKMNCIRVPVFHTDFGPDNLWLQAVSHCKCVLNSKTKTATLELPLSNKLAKPISCFISFSRDTSFATVILNKDSKIEKQNAVITELTFINEPTFTMGDTLYGKFAVRCYEKYPSYYDDIWAFFKCVYEEERH
jgi:hypothetical protein